jgi:AcrR family transcriptional regulator
MATRKKKRAAVGDARTRFLTAAERLFATHGYDGTSIRAIAQAAGANLATLTHYWGSKGALFRDLFERRFRALNDEHVRRLKQLNQEENRGNPVPLRELLMAFVEPPFTVSAMQAARLGDPEAVKDDRHLFHLIFGRALTDPSEDVVAAMNEIFGEMIQLFFRLLRKQRLDLDPQELYWRVVCVSGVQVFAHAHSERIGRFVMPALEGLDDPLAAERMVNFILAGMTAPPLAAAKKSRGAKQRKGAAA